jgi:hypothetical protein
MDEQTQENHLPITNNILSHDIPSSKQNSIVYRECEMGVKPRQEVSHTLSKWIHSFFQESHKELKSGVYQTPMRPCLAEIVSKIVTHKLHNSIN